MMINCLFVGMGGFIGSVCRYLLGLLPLYIILSAVLGVLAVFGGQLLVRQR